ncbi:helicase/secretion neighborhood TadE-like protein [Mycolicibacterium rutilum]|uniref:Helicase/secretion neighborhood TadE-like protein n=1 Tax=Mycolicibacterium rutilum TaxID=370526 RepID=A0A1H6JI64_MYCRU|nr:Rv3654c family TadE-like protein [Mycolicibacterium rutilum]SEH60493.1 helicase/secretion neighborhood TadE-like protein [Mycolicibacterium rutilum]
MHARWRRSSRAAADDGAATVLAAVMIAVLLAVTVAAGYLGAAVIARHRAQAAADLSALAAAGRVADGPAAACAHASTVSESMRAHLRSCRVDELDVVVAVEVTIALGRFGVGPAAAVARAGP